MQRVETDEALKFCRVDGATLVIDSSSIEREAGVARYERSSYQHSVAPNGREHQSRYDSNKCSPAGRGDYMPARWNQFAKRV